MAAQADVISEERCVAETDVSLTSIDDGDGERKTPLLDA